MEDDEPTPVVYIHYDYSLGCWIIKAGHVDTPIRRGLFADPRQAVEAMLSVKTSANGRVQVRVA